VSVAVIKLIALAFAALAGLLFGGLPANPLWWNSKGAIGHFLLACVAAACAVVISFWGIR
jgi:hypothetical protein